MLENTYKVIADNGTYNAITTDIDNSISKLTVSKDLTNGNEMRYAYENGHIKKVGVFNSSGTKINEEELTYDDADRITTDAFTYNNMSNSVQRDITYATESNSPTADGRVLTYSYKVNGTEKVKTQNRYNDSYKRLTAKLVTMGGYTYDKGFTYSKTRISKVMDVKNGSTFHNVSYSYDALGRITSEVDSADTDICNTYVYDSFGQLVRENNKALDKTFVYCYNNIGNITSAKAYAYTTGSVEGLSALSTDSYTYDTTNKDKLTYFGGAAVPCNAMGYHSGYNGYIVSWTNGKISRLSKGLLPIGMHDYNYSYNALGQRVGISYTYTPPTSSSSSAVAMGTLLGYSKSYDYDQSGRLISESRTNEYYGEEDSTEKIVFLYDEAGMVGFVYTTSGASNTYYFDKNIRGDVIGIYDASGAQIVKYSYDAWGNCTIDSSTTNTALAKINPIRYRGYYYDEDIKLYYLNSRYYSPLWRRFISPATADALNPQSANGLNLYVYAGNNPVALVYTGSFSYTPINTFKNISTFTTTSNRMPKLVKTLPISSTSMLNSMISLSSVLDTFIDPIASIIQANNDFTNEYYYLGISSIHKTIVRDLEMLGYIMSVYGVLTETINSMYDDAQNPNYTQKELEIAGVLDATYYSGKMMLLYLASKKASASIVEMGVTIGGVKGAATTLLLSIGYIILANCISDVGDYAYEQLKKFIFE